jgi:CheY-like chemotaxis protein
MTSILLIDDEVDVRDSMAKVLGREGYDVITVDNADAGLATLKTQNVDLLISDIIMPGMDGVQAIKQIRADYPDIKILAISGGGNFGLKAYKPEAITTTAYLQAATEAGADWVLTKPFERAEIVACARKLVPPE